MKTLNLKVTQAVRQEARARQGPGRAAGTRYFVECPGNLGVVRRGVLEAAGPSESMASLTYYSPAQEGTQDLEPDRSGLNVTVRYTSQAL